MESNKRKDREFDEPIAKRFHLDETTRQPMKLVDLNDHVLDKIFSYLDAQDLVNIVKYDNVFLSGSRRVFKNIFKTDYIELPLKEEVFFTTKSCFIRTAELLRYFGESITKLKVVIDDDNPIDRRIFHLIVTYCCETLTELIISYSDTEWKINKPFTKLKTLIFYEGSADLSTCRFDKCFPALENLEFDCVSDIGKTLNRKRKIASLKCLKLDFSDEDYDGKSFHIDDLHRFMQCNPQLNELRLTLVDFNIDTHTRLPSLHDEIIPGESLTIQLNIPFNEYDFEHSNVLSQLKIPNNRICHLEVKPAVLTSQICAYIAKCVKVALNVSLWLDDISDPFQEAGWIDSTKHEHLTDLEISMIFYASNEDSYSEVGHNAIRPYLYQCENLTTITVRYKLSLRRRRHETLNLVFDPLRSQIDLKIWTFTQEILPNEISFALNKITAL